MPLDVVFGSLATLIGAVGTFLLTHKRTDGEWISKTGKLTAFLATVPPILSNTVIVPFVLAYVYMYESLVPELSPVPFFMITVAIGEIISCCILGLFLYAALYPRRKQIFG